MCVFGISVQSTGLSFHISDISIDLVFIQDLIHFQHFKCCFWRVCVCVKSEGEEERNLKESEEERERGRGGKEKRGGEGVRRRGGRNRERDESALCR